MCCVEPLFGSSPGVLEPLSAEADRSSEKAKHRQQIATDRQQRLHANDSRRQLLLAQQEESSAFDSSSRRSSTSGMAPLRSLKGTPRGLGGTPRGLAGSPRGLGGTPRGLGFGGTPRSIGGPVEDALGLLQSRLEGIHEQQRLTMKEHSRIDELHEKALLDKQAADQMMLEVTMHPYM